MGLFDGRGTTTVRSRFARKVTAPNRDEVTCAIKIPPGCTVERVHVNNLIIGTNPIPVEHATESSTYGYLITDPSAYHGYGSGIGAFDNMWDDRVPKDKDSDSELEDLDNDSITGSRTQATNTDDGAVESGVFSGSNEGGEIQLNEVLDLGFGPEQTFSRVRRMDVSTGIVSESNKFTAIDKCVTTLNKRYHVPEDRYGYYLMAVGASNFDAVSSYDSGHAYAADYYGDLMWLYLQKPELAGIWNASIGQDETMKELYAAMAREHLELAYIENDTYKDLDDSNDNLVDFIVYSNVTLTYRRPGYDTLHLTSRA